MTHPKTPSLLWTEEAKAHCWKKHRVRWETLDRIPGAGDLRLEPQRFGRLMLQGSVEGKCYRLIGDVLDVEDMLLEPVTGYRYAKGDKKGDKP